MFDVGSFRSSDCHGLTRRAFVTLAAKNDAAQHPNFGSVIARHKRSGSLPPFVSVAPLTTLSHGFDSTRNEGFGGGRRYDLYQCRVPA